MPCRDQKLSTRRRVNKTGRALLLGVLCSGGALPFCPQPGEMVPDFGGLTVQLPDPHPVLVGEPVVQGITHGALVVGLHDGACGCHVAQPDGMAKLMDSHREQVHIVGIWEHREQWVRGGTASRAGPRGWDKFVHRGRGAPIRRGVM